MAATAIKELAMSAGNGAASGAGAGVGAQLGYGLGQLTGFNKSMDKRQIRQQKALTDIQYTANLGLTKAAYEEQKNLWDKTNLESQVSHAKNAGLNPALLYQSGGPGGSTGSGSSSVSGSQASDSAATQNANTNQTALGMAMMKMQSEIELNKSVANKNNAEAETTNQTRSGLVEKLRQEGHGLWLDNLKSQYEMSPEGEVVYKNKATGKTAAISETGLFNRKISADIAKTVAEGKLTDEKAIGYFQELLNDTARADAAGVQAAATKLAAEFNYGELYNTKWWIQTGQMVVDDIFKGIGVRNLKPNPTK